MTLMQRNRKPLPALLLLIGLSLTLCAAPQSAQAQAQAQDRFADAVLRYDPLFSGGPAPRADFADPLQALGAPNANTATGTGFVSLGNGGLIELAFLNNLLTNSGSSAADLFVYEIGQDVEDTFVSIRPTAATLSLLGSGFDTNGDGFFEIGKVFGGTATIDIDAIFAGFAAGVLRFDAVQLIDDRFAGQTTGASVGADIDAVEALSSVPIAAAIPEPGTLALLAIGVMPLAGALARKRRRSV